MKFYYIYVHRQGDGLGRLYPYLGETEEVESADYGGGGFHVQNHNTRNAIAFGENMFFQEPYKIEGSRNLASHIQRIVVRLREGAWDDVDEIRIKIREE